MLLNCSVGINSNTNYIIKTNILHANILKKKKRIIG